MKLIIQIPCLNEENTLPVTFADLPRQIPGIDVIEVMIIDDGSTDGTVAVARQLGINHIVHHTSNKGLAAAFKSGLDACLQLGADIIVNTDADNQYPGASIADLVAPIVDGHADMVIGDRQIQTIAHFSRSKKLLQKLGSAVVRYASGTEVPDAPSGFRALSREAAMRMNIFTGYTYTLETIIQAGKKNLTIAHVPIRTNPKTRESRLIKSTSRYLLRSIATILRLFLLYEPLRSFSYASLPPLLVGLVLWGRYLFFLLVGEAARGSNVQSIVVGSVAFILSGLVFMIGLLGELIAVNRRLQEESLYHMRSLQFDRAVETRVESHDQTFG